jgi:peptidyl-prolyl cis-trans isomerase B (cyclophilin B)
VTEPSGPGCRLQRIARRLCFAAVPQGPVIKRSFLACTAIALTVAGCGSQQNALPEPPASLATPPPAKAPTLPAGCTSVPAPAPKATVKAAKPTLRLNPAKTTAVTMLTNCGSFTITLDVKRAPKTAASFASLVKQGFYSGLTFHRIDSQLGVIQGGDPLGTGSGGAGYSVVEKPPKGTRYTVGTVAMAKTGAEPAGTSGSQFFIVTGNGAASLPPDYAITGQVTQGQDVVQRIASVPADPSQHPTSPVVIQTATLSG